MKCHVVFTVVSLVGLSLILASCGTSKTPNRVLLSVTVAPRPRTPRILLTARCNSRQRARLADHRRQPRCRYHSLPLTPGLGLSPIRPSQSSARVASHNAKSVPQAS